VNVLPLLRRSKSQTLLFSSRLVLPRIVLADNKTGGLFINGPRRREVAGRAIWLLVFLFGGFLIELL